MLHDVNQEKRQLTEIRKKAKKLYGTNHWSALDAAERILRQEDPELFADGPQPSTVNGPETAEQVNRLRQDARFSNCNRSETFFALTGRELKKEAPKGPVKVRYTFAKQPAPIRFSMNDLLLEFCNERGLEPTSENLQTARQFFNEIAQRRGMLHLDPFLLHLDDLNYENYKLLTQL